MKYYIAIKYNNIVLHNRGLKWKILLNKSIIWFCVYVHKNILKNKCLALIIINTVKCEWIYVTLNS